MGVGVTQAGSDQGQLMPALDEIQGNLGRLPEQGVAEGGFTTQETVLATAERGGDLMGGEREAGAPAARAGNLERRGMAPEFRPEALAYDATPNTSTCPASKVLTYQGREDRVGVIRPRYQAPARDCRACPFRPSCCPQTSRGGTLVRSEKVPVVAAFVAKMQTEAARQISRWRGAVAEFTNLGLKAKLGLRQLRVRGLKKVRCEALRACLTYNIQQWIRLRWRTSEVQVV